MTKQTATEYVADHSDDTADPDDLPEVFAALYGREPDAEDEQTGIWSLCCAGVDDEDDEEG